MSIEIPLGKRTRQYRFFEMLPGLLSYGALIALPLLAWWSAAAASIYLLLVIFTMLVKAVSIGVHTIKGYRRLVTAQEVDWSERLSDISTPADSLSR